MKTNQEIRALGLEAGAAEIRIKLEEGRVVMSNADGTYINAEGELASGKWSQLFASIQAIVELNVN